MSKKDTTTQDQTNKSNVEENTCSCDPSTDPSCQDPICMPKPTFTTFVLSLASSAMVQLGEMPNPESGRVEENTLLAKHTIDILSMLQEKTKNNLDSEEIRLLEGMLYELRMKYVVKK